MQSHKKISMFDIKSIFYIFVYLYFFCGHVSENAVILARTNLNYAGKRDLVIKRIQ